MGSENQASDSSALTLFGMSPEKGRWIFVALGLAINMCLGYLLVERFPVAPARTMVYRCDR